MSMLSFVKPSSAPKTSAHWSQKTPAFRHAEKCRFEKNGTELVPRGEGELKALAAGPPEPACPSATKKIVAAMIATPKLLATASSLLADIKSKVKLQRENRGAW